MNNQQRHKLAAEMLKTAKELLASENTVEPKIASKTVLAKTLADELKTWKEALMNAKTKEQALQIMKEVKNIKKQIEDKFKK